jgi:hypothetical protein
MKVKVCSVVALLAILMLVFGLVPFIGSKSAVATPTPAMWQVIPTPGDNIILDDVMPSPDGGTLFLSTTDPITDTSTLWRSPMPATSASWVAVSTADTPGWIIRLNPEYADDPIIYWCDHGGTGIMRSADGGEIFASRTAPAPITDVAVEDSHTLYLASGSNVRKSTNGGVAWELPSNPAAGNLADVAMAPDYPLLPVPGNVLVGGTGGAVSYSADGGASFMPLSSSPATGNMQVCADEDYADNNIVYAGSSNGGVYRYAIGISAAWEQIDSTVANVSGLAMHYGSLYAADATPGGGVVRGGDRLTNGLSGGETFAQVPNALRCSAGLLFAIDTTGNKLYEYAPQDSFMVYQTKPIIVTAESVEERALKLFKAINPAIELKEIQEAMRETPELYYVSIGELYMESCKVSGSVWFADRDKLYNDEYAPEKLPSEKEARDIADGFLKEQGLVPRGVQFEFINVGETTSARFDGKTKKVEMHTNHLDVIYGIGLNGSSVDGPGAKDRVSIGEGGKVIGLHSVWREVEPMAFYPAITSEEATAIFKEKFKGDIKELAVKRAYWGESEFTKQTFLQPYYIFNGTVLVEGREVTFKTQMVPATTFSPIAKIISPVDGAEFPEAKSIKFEASVLGGTPPYDYEWESTIDGVIAREPSFSKALSAGVKEGRVIPRTIQLTVTDKNGNEAKAIVSVMVKPAAAALSTQLPVESEPSATQFLLTGEASPNDDSNNREVGIEWVNAYGGKGTLSNNDNNARGFRNELLADGWTSRFDWGNNAAWEQDFRYRSAGGGGCAGGGGEDYKWIDAVDFAFFSGHGDPRYILFKAKADKQEFYFDKARWGGNAGGNSGEQGDLEWIVLDACLTLKKYYDPPGCGGPQSVWDRWDQAFDGLHYVLGFDTTCLDNANRGRIFAQRLRAGWTVREAWIRATQATESSSTYGAYLRALKSGTNTWNDHLPGHGYVSPDPYPPSGLAWLRWSC